MNNNDNEKNNDVENERIAIEKQLAFGIWVQAVGQVMELVGLIRLSLLDEDLGTVAMTEVLSGASIQTIGTFFEAIGVSNQISNPDNESRFDAQVLAVTGDWLQSVGAALEAMGGSDEILIEQQQNGRLFVP